MTECVAKCNVRNKMCIRQHTSRQTQSVSVWDTHTPTHTHRVWYSMNTACTVCLKHIRFTEDHNLQMLPAGRDLGKLQWRNLYKWHFIKHLPVNICVNYIFTGRKTLDRWGETLEDDEGAEGRRSRLSRRQLAPLCLSTGRSCVCIYSYIQDIFCGLQLQPRVCSSVSVCSMCVCVPAQVIRGSLLCPDLCTHSMWTQQGID